MRTLEVRRHTMRRKPGQRLSQDGIELARLVGDGSGHFDLVVSSDVPRAIETAIAMGYEVNEIDPMLGQLPDDVFDAGVWPASFDKEEQAVASEGPISSSPMSSFASGQASCRKSPMEAKPWL